MPSLAPINRAVGLAFRLSPISQLLQTLSPESQVTLRKLASVLATPADAPAMLTVLAAATGAVDAYGKTLVALTDEFKQIARMLDALKEECSRNPQLCPVAADDPLRRRLLKNSPWALLLEMSKFPTPNNLLVAAGVELAYSLATGKIFANGYATNLRRALGPALDFLRPAFDAKDGEPAWLPHFRKVSCEARKLFEAYPHPPNNDRQTSFGEAAGKALRGASLLPDARHRQGILDHSHLSPAMVIESAKALRRAATDGCEDSALAMLAYISGLPLRLAHLIPLAGASDDWVMELNLEAGVLRTDLDPVFTNAAHTKQHAAHRPAGRVITKPLPHFLADLLILRLHGNPDAQSVEDLLPRATCDGSRLTLADDTFGIEPSIARFVRSAAGFAIDRGIDRLAASVLSNDFGIIPASKLYYCHIERQEIWDVATRIYDDLCWGLPAPYSDGLSFGSRVAPARKAISAWHSWLRDDLDQLRPGKNCRLESLLAFHNRFADACAALAVFCLASRGTARVRITADALTENTRSIMFYDKRVGHLPRPLPVPVNAVLAEQARLWKRHCRALDRRLANKEIAVDAPIRLRLNAVVNEDRVEMFFHIDDNFQSQAISCHQLSRSWPVEFGFEPDFGRHFWETELRRAGVKSSLNDLLLRHQVVGLEGHRSTADESVAMSFASIVKAQEKLLRELGVGPLIGLAK